MIENGVITTDHIYDVVFRVDLIPKSNTTSRPGYPMEPCTITQHNTGNRRKGANADMHTEYVDNTPSYVSWHFTVDDKEIIQELPINENAWHAGDGGNGPGNRTSIAIETCEHEGIDWQKAKENTIKLIVFLMNKVQSLRPDPVVPHRAWSGKYCPHRILDEGWGQYIKDIKVFKESLNKELTLEEALKIINQKCDIDIKYWDGACNYVGYLRELLIKIAQSM